MEIVSKEAPEVSSAHKEVISTIASGVNALKSKLVSMANKNKKVWRAMVKTSTDSVAPTCTSSEQPGTQDEIASPARYNLRSTPTRQAAAIRSQKQSVNPVASNGGGTCRQPNISKLTQTVYKNKQSAETCGLSDETLDTKSSELEEPLARGTQDEHATTIVTVPVVELERAKQMAQQLTALISNLEHQESEVVSGDIDSLEQ